MSKKTTYIKIYECLKDGAWHDFTDFCNKFVGGKEGDKRLREMKLMGYIRYEWKYKPNTHTTQYRITETFPAWYGYLNKKGFMVSEPNGQMAFA